MSRGRIVLVSQQCLQYLGFSIFPLCSSQHVGFIFMVISFWFDYRHGVAMKLWQEREECAVLASHISS